jgi:hypothetical protein
MRQDPLPEILSMGVSVELEPQNKKWKTVEIWLIFHF